MSFMRILRLSLIHIAVAIALVPINSTLNRLMISEFGLPATFVALLVVLPYLFSPMQVWIGGLADRYPLFGYRRTPYIGLGLLLCIGGTALAPFAALQLGEGISPLRVLFGMLAFGAWGLGFNCATVSYLSLATELAGEQHRARTVGVMWFMLIVSVIITGISLGRALDPYSPLVLIESVLLTCGIALVLGLLGVIGLEPRHHAPIARDERQRLSSLLQMIAANPTARLFFVYLILLLVALLGQDLLLEPFAADVFGVPVRRTTEYTSIWGIALLIALIVTSPLTRRVGKIRAAAVGGGVALAGLLLIAASGIFHMQALLIPALVVFGFGSGISTAANLALMLDMTIPGQVGAFVGAWGVADALARLCGTLLSGVVRDTVATLTSNLTAAYVTVFLLEATALLVSLVLLRRISVERFREGSAPNVRELAALVGEA